jgi:hypothetical protein
MVDERSGCVRHPPATTRRTESTSLAREGNEPTVSTRVAMDTQKSVSEHPTFKIRPDLSLHEPSDGRALPSRPSQEGLDLLADHFVEQGLFGFVAFVLDGDKVSIGIVRWSALRGESNQRAEATATRGFRRNASIARSDQILFPCLKTIRCRAPRFTRTARTHGLRVAHWQLNGGRLTIALREPRFRLAGLRSCVAVVPGTGLDRNTAAIRVHLRSVSRSGRSCSGRDRLVEATRAWVGACAARPTLVPLLLHEVAHPDSASAPNVFPSAGARAHSMEHHEILLVWATLNFLRRLGGR